MLAEIRDEIDLEPAYGNEAPLPVMFCGLCKHFDDRRNCCLIKRELEWVGEWQQWLLARRTTLPAAIADVDRDVLWYQGYALAQKGQPLPEGAIDAVAAGHQAAVDAGNLIAA